METTIVISRYNESLEWIQTPPFCHHPIIIYNKGANQNFAINGAVIAIQELPNVGRESHTYLHHIIQNYDQLANVTIFLPGSCNIPYKYANASNVIHSVQETKNTFFTRSDENLNIYEEYKTFCVDEYLSAEPANRSVDRNVPLTLSAIRPFGKWYEHHFGKGTITTHACSHGIFAVHKRDILKQPRSYYENLIRELEVSADTEVGHYFERAWGAIFGKFVAAT